MRYRKAKTDATSIAQMAMPFRIMVHTVAMMVIRNATATKSPVIVNRVIQASFKSIQMDVTTWNHAMVQTILYTLHILCADGMEMTLLNFALIPIWFNSF